MRDPGPCCWEYLNITGVGGLILGGGGDIVTRVSERTMMLRNYQLRPTLGLPDSRAFRFWGYRFGA